MSHHHGMFSPAHQIIPPAATPPANQPPACSAPGGNNGCGLFGGRVKGSGAFCNLSSCLPLRVLRDSVVNLRRPYKFVPCYELIAPGRTSPPPAIAPGPTVRNRAPANSTHRTVSRWALLGKPAAAPGASNYLPTFTSQSLIVLSMLAVARVRPSGQGTPKRGRRSGTGPILRNWVATMSIYTSLIGPVPFSCPALLGKPAAAPGELIGPFPLSRCCPTRRVATKLEHDVVASPVLVTAVRTTRDGGDADVAVRRPAHSPDNPIAPRIIYEGISRLVREKPSTAC